MPKLNYSYSYNVKLSRSICYSWNQNAPKTSLFLMCKCFSSSLLPSSRCFTHLSSLPHCYLWLYSPSCASSFYIVSLALSLTDSLTALHHVNLSVSLLRQKWHSHFIGQAKNAIPFSFPDIDFKARVSRLADLALG